MKLNRLRRLAAPLLCVALVLSNMGVAFAASGEEETAVSGITLRITAPIGWTAESASAAFSITDDTGGGFETAEYRLGDSGSWVDVTGKLSQSGQKYSGSVTVTENGVLSLRVTGYDGAVYEKSCAIQCIDRTAPVLHAAMDGTDLRVTVTDDLSGVEAVYLDGTRYDGLTKNTLTVPLAKLDSSAQTFSLWAVDGAGNESKAVTVTNTCYQAPSDSPDTQQPAPSPVPSGTPAAAKPTAAAKPSSPSVTTTQAAATTSAPIATSSGTDTSASTSASTSAAATADPEASPDTTARTVNTLTPDGQGTVVDNATEEDGKEFFTFTTPNDHVFYLIVDRQKDSDNVYFLNAVTEEDLLALAEKEEDTQEVSAVPDPEPVCTCRDRCEAGAVNTACPVCVLSWQDCTGTAATTPVEEDTEQEEEGGGAGTVVIVLLVALAVGGAGYYFKIYKPKHDLDDAEDFDDLTGTEETINEDEEPDDYDGYDEPEEPEDYGD